MKNKHNGKHSQGDTPLKMQEEQMSAQQILSSGEEAARLLDSPVYNLAHRSVIQNLQDEWMATRPHEKEKREGLYQMIRGLSTVSGELAMMIEQAKRVGEDELAAERKKRQVTDYDENTGFQGLT